MASISPHSPFTDGWNKGWNKNVIRPRDEKRVKSSAWRINKRESHQIDDCACFGRHRKGRQYIKVFRRGQRSSNWFLKSQLPKWLLPKCRIDLLSSYRSSPRYCLLEDGERTLNLIYDRNPSDFNGSAIKCRGLGYNGLCFILVHIKSFYITMVLCLRISGDTFWGFSGWDSEKSGKL